AARELIGPRAADKDVAARAADEVIGVRVANDQAVAFPSNDTANMKHAVGRTPVDQAGRLERQVNDDVAAIVLVLQRVRSGAAVDKARDAAAVLEEETVAGRAANQVLEGCELDRACRNDVYLVGKRSGIDSADHP